MAEGDLFCAAGDLEIMGLEELAGESGLGGLGREPAQEMLERTHSLKVVNDVT